MNELLTRVAEILDVSTSWLINNSPELIGQLQTYWRMDVLYPVGSVMLIVSLLATIVTLTVTWVEDLGRKGFIVAGIMTSLSIIGCVIMIVTRLNQINQAPLIKLLMEVVK